jgi:hypothetical protein
MASALRKSSAWVDGHWLLRQLEHELEEVMQRAGDLSAIPYQALVRPTKLSDV